MWRSHDLHGLLTAAPAHPLHTCQSHSIHHVTCQAKRHSLGSGQKLSLLKCHTWDSLKKRDSIWLKYNLKYNPCCLIFGKCSETFVSPLDVWSIFGNLRNVTEYLQKMVKNVVFSIFIKYTKQDTGARGFEISLLSRCAHPWEIELSTRRQISYLRAPMS